MPSAQTRSRQRSARLRSAARSALQRYEIEVRRLRLLLDEFNCLYRVETTENVELVLRLSSTRGCHGVDETRAEIAWLNALRRDTDLRVPRPVAMRDGSFVGIVDPDLAPGHRQFVLFKWTPGRTLGDRVGMRTAALLGQAAAALHEHARSFDLPAGRVRRFEQVFPYADERFEDREPILVFDGRFGHLFPPARRAVYERARDAAQAAIDELFRDGAPPRLIHNDLHPWNVVMDDRRLAVLDFEDLMWGHPIQDIATTFYYFRCRPHGAELEAAFRRGYETAAPWPTEHDAKLDALVAGRGLILANTVLAAPDPAMRAQADHYIPLIGRRLEQWVG